MLWPAVLKPADRRREADPPSAVITIRRDRQTHGAPRYARISNANGVERVAAVLRRA
jgi:hypothetical protein